MKNKWWKVWMTTVILGIAQPVFSQNSDKKNLSVDELFDLTEKNHPSLQVSKSDIQIAKQNVEVAKNQMLPSLTTGVQGFYLGDVTILDKDFSNKQTISMPHFGNLFSVNASQLVWKGNAVKNSIEIMSLREQLAQLNYENNGQYIKLLTLGYYLDLYKLQNQERVYLKNIELAEKRLENINKFYKQGMITRNDVIRGELQLSNLKLALQVVNNNEDILNKQLTTALGLSENTKIIPDADFLQKNTSISFLDYYKDAVANHPAVKMTEKAVDTYGLSYKITKSELYPTVSLFGGNTLQRPITTSLPARDMYSNSWNAGVSINYNIDNLFKTPKKLTLNKLEQEKAISQSNEAKQMISVAVNAAYIKYNEAITQNSTLRKNTELTSENYRIMESKYNNQLAILLDLIDASNAKLDAELQYANSEVNIVYAYYKLLKESGTL